MIFTAFFLKKGGSSVKIGHCSTDAAIWGIQLLENSGPHYRAEAFVLNMTPLTAEAGGGAGLSGGILFFHKSLLFSSNPEHLLSLSSHESCWARFWRFSFLSKLCIVGVEYTCKMLGIAKEDFFLLKRAKACIKLNSQKLNAIPKVDFV